MYKIMHMQAALSLAKRANGATSPNPMVGAVLVKNGRTIASDYHRAAGLPHAEALVIEKAGTKARGADLYVTLEPCCHTKKRTPPCTDAIIKAGIKRIIVAMSDPNPYVSGRGFAILRHAGIEVIEGVLEHEARELNKYYIKYITTGLPYTILKSAMTLDGKIAQPDGVSKWITGEKSRQLVHKIRADVDAVITGIGTVLKDDPQMTVRVGRGKRNPVRIVIDPNLKIPESSSILITPPHTIIVTKTSNSKAERLKSMGIEILTYEGVLSMKRLFRRLAKNGIISILIEAGSTLNAHALRAGVVDKVMFFIAPKIMGGRDSYTPVGGDFIRPLKDAYKIYGLSARRVGEDYLLEGMIEHGKG